MHTHLEALRTQSIGPFRFDGGTIVDDAAVTFDIDVPEGTNDGLVIICPSLTGTPAILREWWRDVAPTAALERWTTLYAHGFTRATTAGLAPESPPSIRDIARGIVAVVASLGLPKATFVTGGSLGGMIALETAIESGAPTHGLVLAAPAVQSAWGAGWNMIQLQALAAGDTAGFALARAVGMMTYRTEGEFEARFGADAASADGRTMQGYLRHHGDKLIARFDATEYEQRVRAMDTHDVGRDRGGWRTALAPHAARLSAAGVVGDTLYSADIVQRWANAVDAEYTAITSIHGHDAFLLEREQVRAVIARAFARATVAAGRPV
jgi:homoserine O-acetyltransferase